MSKIKSEPPAPLLPEEGWPKTGVEGVVGGEFGGQSSRTRIEQIERIYAAP